MVAAAVDRFLEHGLTSMALFAEVEGRTLQNAWSSDPKNETASANA